MKADRKTFVMSRQAFTYIRSLQPGQPADKDSIHKYDAYIFNQTGLVPNNGRFEGFKSSGKIGAIEHPGLQNDIMDLYQENIPVLILYTNHYSKQKAALNDYFNQNLRRSNTHEKDNFLALFSTDMVYNMGNELLEVQPIISQYDKCIANMETIIAEVNKEYKD
jgi:mRNA degradation ribonuclease J1/J2